MLRVFHMLLVTGLLAACSDEQFVPQQDLITLRSPPAGQVVGFESQYGAHVWRGLPFAESPTGDLRWRAPNPLMAWKGIGKIKRHFS